MITYQDPLLLLNETAYVQRHMELQECFSKLVQKTSDVSIWHAIREELLRNGRCSSLYRETHASIIEGHLQRANQSLLEIAELAQRIVLPR